MTGITHLGSLVAVLTKGGVLKLATVSRYGAVLRGALAPADFTTTLVDRPVAFLDSRTMILMDRGTTMPESSLRVIDISDPDNPTQIGQYPLPKSTSWAVIVAGTRVIAAGSYRVQVFDAQDRYSLQSTSNPQERERLDIWDFTNPASPILKSRMNLASAKNLVFAGDWGYQAETGLILDMSDPAQPAPAGNFSLPNPSVSQIHDVIASTEFLATVSCRGRYSCRRARFEVACRSQPFQSARYVPVRTFCRRPYQLGNI